MKLSLLTLNVFEKSPRKNAVRTVTCHHCLEDDQNGLIIDVDANLPNTIDDARGLADVLKDQLAASISRSWFCFSQARPPVDRGLLAGLDKLAKRRDEKSTVVIYFFDQVYSSSDKKF
jgi:hypothetical protein